MNFRNKTVWITGATSGIGEALALAFAEQKANLILSARRVQELERVKNLCKNSPQILIVPLDLENEHELMPEKAKQVYSQFTQVDILINNGGISQRSLVQDTDLQVDKRIMNTNYFGTVALTKAVLPYMIAEKSGHIVVVSSVIGKFGTPLRSAYAGSKHALQGFFDSLRAEVTRYNIAVTIFCPGYIQTNVSVHALVGDGSEQAKMNKSTAAGMKTDEFARRALRAIAKKKREVYIGGKEIYAIYLKRFFPGIFSQLVKNQTIE